MSKINLDDLRRKEEVVPDIGYTVKFDEIGNIISVTFAQRDKIVPRLIENSTGWVLAAWQTQTYDARIAQEAA